ncbi:MAG: hypothetical protein AB7D05_07415 [Mangrovibacterium sp.]
MKAPKHIILLLILWAGWHPVMQARELRARAVPDTTHVLIGDQFRLLLELEQPEHINVAFPEIGDTLTSTVEVIARSPLDTFKLEPEKQLRIVSELLLTSFDTGRQVIPSFQFELQHNKLKETIETLPVEFFVHGLPIDTTRGPADIKKPYGAPVNLQEASPYILGIILIGALLFFLFYYLHRRRNNQPVFGRATKPQAPPHIVALRELDRIKQEQLWQHNQIKAYYSEISDTLREYIEKRYTISAMEYTTEEILGAFRQRKDLLEEKTFDQLKNILGLADLVKFAKYEPLEDDHQLTLMNAYLFVNSTKEEEEISPPRDDREGEEVELK